MEYSQEDSQPSQDSFMTVTDEDRHEVLYFAYGPNLSTARMRRQCPYSTPIGLGYLSGWRWVINSRGLASMVPASSKPELAEQGDTPRGVYGLIYLLPPRDEELLDTYEDVPKSCEKIQCSGLWIRDGQGREVAGGLGEKVSVLVYVDEKHTEDGVRVQADGDYAALMQDGLEDAVENWGLEREYANWVMSEIGKGKGKEIDVAR